MTYKHLLPACMLACLLAAGCGAGAHEVALPQEEYPCTSYDLAQALGRLNLWRVEQEWPGMESPPEGVEDLEMQPIPQATDVATDLPRYFLYKDRSKRQFYVLRSGTATQPARWFGPLAVQRDHPQIGFGFGTGVLIH